MKKHQVWWMINVKQRTKSYNKRFQIFKLFPENVRIMTFVRLLNRFCSQPLWSYSSFLSCLPFFLPGYQKSNRQIFINVAIPCVCVFWYMKKVQNVCTFVCDFRKSCTTKYHRQTKKSNNAHTTSRKITSHVIYIRS